ncbi:MAG: methionine ABC transporter substrate-binding protein [Dethiosulfovibrio peptidovorans]|nr:MAG: methionine ABC transporter substrate-binding protein [Dethiosulfovibrio peptidovorans]
MKKTLAYGRTILGAVLVLLTVSGAWASQALVVGASPVPHAQLLDLVRDDLHDQGIELRIVEFTDYVKPNLALQEGELDANFFQHLPYLKSFVRDHKLDLVSAGAIHVEPLGLYSKRHARLEDIPQEATIAIPSDSVNGGRALLLLQARGLIRLSDSAGLEATELDVVENPKKIRFKSIEAAQLPRVLQDVDGAVINGNYAIEAGLKPTEDALVLEGEESPYANIVAVRSGEQNGQAVKALVAILQSDKVRRFILESYGGGVVPAF